MVAPRLRNSQASLEQNANSVGQIMCSPYPSAIPAGRLINQSLPKNSQLCSEHYPVYPKSTGCGGKYKVRLCWKAPYI